MRRFPITQAFIDSQPRFKLNDPARPKLRRGQMTIVFECLERAYPKSLSLRELENLCSPRYKETLRNPKTIIIHSFLYQLNLIPSAETV